MTNSITYENEELLIPYAYIEKLVESFDIIHKDLSPKHECLSTEYVYKKQSDYIPFTLVDREITTFVDTKLHDAVLEDGTYKATAPFLMTSVLGTRIIDHLTPTNSILPTFHTAREYTLTEHLGPEGRMVQKTLGNVAKKLWKAYEKGEDLKIKMSQEVYNLISITTKAVENADLYTAHKQIFIPSEALIDAATKLKQPAKNTKYVETFRVVYELDKEDLFCINTVAKFFTDKSVKVAEVSLDSNLKTTSNSTAIKSFDIRLDTKGNEAVAKYLSNPLEINYKVSHGTKELSTSYYIDIKLPSDFISLVYNSLNISKSGVGINDSVEVILSKKSFPEIEEYLHALIEEQVEYLIEFEWPLQTADDKYIEHKIDEACASYLDVLGHTE